MLPDIQPGNTKILYFFNCLLDGMHTKIPSICDFSRGGLDVRLCAHIQTLLRGHKQRVLFSFSGYLLFELNRVLSLFGRVSLPAAGQNLPQCIQKFRVTSKNIYKSKNKIKIMPKNSSKYLDKLKECKNISHIFIDNLKGRIYNRKQLREG